ncbi:hypothetical protein ACH5RR_025791 [Cinchona calisaya]|uniref:Uncharacterized protein n=1 Tax=Cinchona calisaya TaxID=153742 RepID=A0ABD2Z0N3_9GENT
MRDDNEMIIGIEARAASSPACSSLCIGDIKYHRSSPGLRLSIVSKPYEVRRKSSRVGISNRVWRSIGNPYFFFRPFSFPVTQPKDSASLLVLQKNRITSFFIIYLGEKKHLPIRKLDIKRMYGSVCGGASGIQFSTSKIRTSLPADHCHPILE